MIIIPEPVNQASEITDSQLVISPWFHHISSSIGPFMRTVINRASGIHQSYTNPTPILHQSAPATIFVRFAAKDMARVFGGTPAPHAGAEPSSWIAVDFTGFSLGLHGNLMGFNGGLMGF